MPSMNQMMNKEDVKLINDVFSRKSEAQVIEKNASGMILKPKREIVNLRGYAIQSFYGRTLRHSKSLKKTGERQVLVGKMGMRYEDIPSSLRDQVDWDDSDFI